MGDTGSLFLGGAIAALAFAFDMPLILILVGIIYIAETMSDIIQVSYFKATHGKRIFRMAPLHHHLEREPVRKKCRLQAKRPWPSQAVMLITFSFCPPYNNYKIKNISYLSNSSHFAIDPLTLRIFFFE